MTVFFIIMLLNFEYNQNFFEVVKHTAQTSQKTGNITNTLQDLRLRFP